MSGDKKLQDVFHNNLDIYSLVGIETFDLEGVSANKKDTNFLGNVFPEMRQKSKEFVLMIPYGAEEAQISRKMNVSYSEAGKIKENYLNKFPSLQKYMNRCNYMAKKEGYVKTELGRIRHLKEAKSIYILYGERILESRWAKQNGHGALRAKMRTLLNNAKNFPIQGLAAHIVNRAMIAVMREFKKQGLDAWVALQVHDEVTCIVREDQAQQAAGILKKCMEETVKISVPLIAEPLIADTWADAK
jgi:DNA polymerase-1